MIKILIWSFKLLYDVGVWFIRIKCRVILSAIIVSVLGWIFIW